MSDKKYPTLPILSAFGTSMSAIEECQERELSCWYCRDIEQHDIDYVILYEYRLERRIGAPYKVPSNFCTNCGRKLK